MAAVGVEGERSLQRDTRGLRLGEFERFRFIGSPIAVGGGGEGGTRCSFAGRGGGARGKVKLDGTTGEAAAEEGSLPLHEAH